MSILKLILYHDVSKVFNPLSQLEFPSLSIGPAHFCLKTCWVPGIFHFMKFLTESSAKNENKSEVISISPIQYFDAEFLC